MDRALVVEVLGTRSGSGLLLADRLVLTAAHLLVPPGRVRADERAAGAVVLRLAGSGVRYTARCVWARYEGPDRGLDVCLLEITSPDWRPLAAAAVRLGRLAGSAEVRVHAFGFPDAAVRAGVAELSPVTGVIHTDSGAQSGRPEIVVDGEPERGPGGASLWVGLSGGPVFAAPGGVTSDVLLGVIISDSPECASRRLRMIPVPAVLADSAAAAITERHYGGLAVLLLPEPSAPSGVRFSLPPDTAVFTGRGKELDRITDAVAGAVGARGVVPIGAIDGMAGVGKTAFAIHAAHHLAEHFPDGQLFVSLHAHAPGQRPVRTGDALGSLLLMDGVAPGRLPARLDERAALWRDRTSGRRMLLLFDDAADSKQIRPLLPGGSGTAVIVTSRRRLAGLPEATRIGLDVMPADDAAVLFTRLADRGDVQVGNSAVDEIITLCEYLPLAIGLTAGQLKHHDSWTAAYLAAQLRSAGSSRLALMAGEDRSVAAAFDLSYRGLSPGQRLAFRRLGLHPGTSLEARAVAALIDRDLPATRTLLDELFDYHLIEELTPGRYRLHDLIRQYCAARALAGDLAGAGRLLDYYELTAARADARLARHTRPGTIHDGSPADHLPLPSRDETLEWMRSERANLTACVGYAALRGQHSRVAALTAGLSSLLRYDGPWDDAQRMHAAAADAARHIGDRLVRANALSDLGGIRSLNNDWRGAEQVLAEALQLYRELGDRLGEANVRSDLGIALEYADDFPGSIEAQERALEIYTAIGDRPGQAVALNELGFARHLAGYSASAVQALEESLSLSRELGNQQIEADAIHRLGRIREETCAYPAAIRDLELALRIYRGLKQPLGQANSLVELGVIRKLTGDYAAAIRNLEEALRLYQKLGQHLGEAGALNELGSTYLASGDSHQAIESLEPALAIYRDLGNRLGEGSTLNEIGAVRREVGDYPEAIQTLEQALSMFEGLEHQQGIAEVLNNLGPSYLKTGRTVLAQGSHERALDLARSVDDTRNEARALEGIGWCALEAGATTTGTDHLRQALVIYQDIGTAEAANLAARLAEIEASGN